MTSVNAQNHGINLYANSFQHHFKTDKKFASFIKVSKAVVSLCIECRWKISCLNGTPERTSDFLFRNVMAIVLFGVYRYQSVSPWSLKE